eukprot:Lithocolla_globosa_v1_NODE_4899_length_1343_cov_7.915373.p1 type:complete len:348 gc:universal NODE_4899_length_1343_cov_7.915373:103-1146(+)
MAFHTKSFLLGFLTCCFLLASLYLVGLARYQSAAPVSSSLVVSAPPASSSVDVTSPWDDVTEQDLADIDRDLVKKKKWLLAGCGDVCDREMTGVPSKYFPFIKKKFNCQELWGNFVIDVPRRVAFSYYKSKGDLFNQAYAGGEAQTPIWTQNEVDDWAKLCSEGKLHGNYGVGDTNAVFQALLNATTVKGGHVLVVGSENPWVEACVLAAGASHITTLEYGRIQSEHPQISTLTPDTIRNKYFSNELSLFDAVVTFSSVEHSGLGRYGDSLNPWGDVQQMARAWCIAKPQANLIIGVMGSHTSPDLLAWNAHRGYGPLTYSHLLANWKQLSNFPAYQEVFLLRKVEE